MSKLQTIIDHADAGLALQLARDIIITQHQRLYKQRHTGTARRNMSKALAALDTARNNLDDVVCELFPDQAAPSIYYAQHRLAEITEREAA